MITIQETYETLSSIEWLIIARSNPPVESWPIFEQRIMLSLNGGHE